jgi:hypothetical protein
LPGCRAHGCPCWSSWSKTAKHPRFDRLYTELAYQPLRELLGYLRTNGFTTCIVSGGGVELIRPMTLEVCDIPAQRVIGSSIKTERKVVSGEPRLLGRPEIGFNDDKVGKPVGINHFIGKRTIAAFGNSDGDWQMLEWTGAGDAEREYACGPANGLPDTRFGAFSPSLMEEATDKGWHVISMDNDWKQIFAPVP